MFHKFFKQYKSKKMDQIEIVIIGDEASGKTQILNKIFNESINL